MIYEINSYKGMNEISFGMEKEKVEKILSEYNVLKNSPKYSGKNSHLNRYIYEDFIVTYDKQNKLNTILFYQPAKVKIRNSKEYLLDKTYFQLFKYFKYIDNELEETSAGFTSYKLGIGIYAPSAEDEPDELVEGIIIFKKGYYD